MPDSPQSNRPAVGGHYVVVARRYRPRGFDELVGQQHVGRALRNAIETSRVGHAYLFTGARGVGKTSTARIFAKALNDPGGPTATPDNTTDVALAIDAGEDVDVIEIDGASNRGIDEIRSLRANVAVRPSRSRFKIYIIDEVHMLTKDAFNALLKTLEEPPQHVKFIFCTTDPERIPVTVLSRCQRFDFAPVEVSQIATRLREIVAAESAEADEAALELIARRAAGSMRDSQSLLEQLLSFSAGKLTADQVHAMLGTADDERLHAMATAMADRDAAEAMRQLDAAIDAGVDAGRLAEQLLGYFRDLMAVAVGCAPSLLRHTSVSLHGELQALGQRWGLQTVLAVVGLIDQTLVRLRHSLHGRVLLEAALVQICSLPDLQSLADLAAAADVKAMAASRVGSEKKKSALNPPQRSKEASVKTLAAEPPALAATASAAARPVEPATAAPLPHVWPAEAQPEVVRPAEAQPEVVRPAEAQPEVVQPEVVQPEVVQPRGFHGNGQPAKLWDQPTAERIWREALSSLESMTETFARVVQSVRASGEGQLRLVFPADATLARKRCELPEHKAALSEAVSRLADRPITIEFELAAAVHRPEPPQAAAPKPSRLQRMREIETHSLVKSCVDLFGAEIVRIDKPR
jgi:DNA polymerase-3 subunit gamma/tau